jgi:hypothetical protein
MGNIENDNVIKVQVWKFTIQNAKVETMGSDLRILELPCVAEASP